MAQIISPGTEWDLILQQLNSNGIEDIYFHYDFIDCYKSDGDRIEAYFHMEENKFLFFPYIKSLVPNHDDLHDFQTAQGYGGPISNSIDEKFLLIAWAGFSEIACQQNLIAGLIRFHPLLKTQNYAKHSPFKLIKDRETIYLSLYRKKEDVWSGFSKDNKHKLNKAKKLGVTVKSDSKLGSLMDFADLYVKRMEELDAHQSYFFDKNYFEKIYKLGPKRFRVYSAYFEEKMIGGALILFSDRFAHYHLSASQLKYFKLSPNNMLRYAVIQDLLGGKQEFLFFGGGRSSDPEDTLLAFKSRFSNERVWYYHATTIINQDTYNHVCQTWEKENPDKKEEFGSFVLKYRY